MQCRLKVFIQIYDDLTNNGMLKSGAWFRKPQEPFISYLYLPLIASLIMTYVVFDQCLFLVKSTIAQEISLKT